MLVEFRKANLASWDESVAIDVASELLRRGRGSSVASARSAPLSSTSSGRWSVRAPPCSTCSATSASTPSAGPGAARWSPASTPPARPSPRRAPWPTTSASRRAPRSCRATSESLPDRLTGSFDVVYTLVGRPDLAGRPRTVGGRGMPVPEARWRLLRRRVPPLRVPAGGGLHAAVPAHRLPLLPVRLAAAPGRGGRLRGPHGRAASHRDVRVEPRLRRDHRPATAPRPAPAAPARVPVHRARSALSRSSSPARTACCA